MTEETIKVPDVKGFVYEVLLRHSPHLGFSTAYYSQNIISQVELNKIHEPTSDNDAEWERYNELFSEWRDEAILNLTKGSQTYFNQPYTSPFFKNDRYH